MYGEVRSTQRLTPSMVRVVLGGGDLDGFVPNPLFGSVHQRPVLSRRGDLHSPI